MSNPPRCGVFPVPTEHPLPAACRTVGLSERENIAELLQALGAALDFPDWYGANFDALFDCLCEAEEIICLHLSGLRDFAARCPADYATLDLVLRAVCDVRADGDYPLLVFLDAADETSPPQPGA